MVEWRTTEGPVPYEEALAFMEARVAEIAAGRRDEMIWLLEHPPLYTAGTSARPEDLTDPGRFPVHVAGRGGQYTYHGPGQRVRVRSDRVAVGVTDEPPRSGNRRRYTGRPGRRHQKGREGGGVGRIPDWSAARGRPRPLSRRGVARAQEGPDLAER